MFINKYPYTDFHELNLDWILGQMIELRQDMKDFVKLNTIKYADPIQWNITTQYEGNTVVIEPNSGNAYISSQPVPSGVAISDTEYWSVIGNFSLLYESIKAAISDLDEENATYSSQDIAKDKLFWLNSTLYQAIIDIPAGTVFVDSGEYANIQAVTIEDLLTDTQELIATTETRLNSSIATMGNTLMSSIMAVQGNIPKDINLIKPETFGAAADGVTDDTQAFNDCIEYASEQGKYILLTGNYKIEGVVYLKSGVNVYGNNATIRYSYTNPDRPLDRDKCPAFNCNNQSHIDIEGISFTGNGAIEETYDVSSCIGGNHSEYINIRNCTFTDEHGLGAVLFERSSHITVQHCVINKYSYSGISFVEGTSYADASYNAVLEGKYAAESSNRYAIMLCGFYDFPVTSDRIGNNLSACYNYIKDTTGYWEGIDCHGGNNVTIAYNVVLGTPQPISVFSQSSRGFSVSKAVIHDNYCISDELHAHTNAPIKSGTFNAVTFSGNDILIHNNFFYASRSTPTNLNGIGLHGQQIEFFNNYAYNLGNYLFNIGSEYGFVNSFIKGNMLYQNVTGSSLILLWRTGTPAISGYIEDNDIVALKMLKADVSISDANCYLWCNNNIYRNLVPTTDYTALIPDFATPSTIASCRGLTGQKAYNLSPSASGYIGWVCTSGGTPGTWKGFGLIQS